MQRVYVTMVCGQPRKPDDHARSFRWPVGRLVVGVGEMRRSMRQNSLLLRSALLRQAEGGTDGRTEAGVFDDVALLVPDEARVHDADLVVHLLLPAGEDVGLDAHLGVQRLLARQVQHVIVPWMEGGKGQEVREGSAGSSMDDARHAPRWLEEAMTVGLRPRARMYSTAAVLNFVCPA